MYIAGKYIHRSKLERIKNGKYKTSLNSGIYFQVYDIPPSSVKGPVCSVPGGEMKPQGVYDIPPTKGVSELLQSSKKVCVCIYWDEAGRTNQKKN